MTMKILAVSDKRQPHFLNPEFLRQHYGDVGMLVSCGDMDADYLDFISTVLNLPLFFVRGNHDTTYGDGSPGGVNLHRRIKVYQGVRMVGLEGSIRYNKDSGAQYTEGQMRWNIFQVLPTLLIARRKYGYSVDLIVTHSPPRHIHDREDNTHRGFKSFLWLLKWTRPRYLIHGHIDIYDQRTIRETHFHHTLVVNINPSRVLTIERTD